MSFSSAFDHRETLFLTEKIQNNICNIKFGTQICVFVFVSPVPALGQIMLYVDGMNGLISHNETVQWLYTLVGSKVMNDANESV